MKALVVDVLARGSSGRRVTVDVIGAGPRAVTSLIEKQGVAADLYAYEVVIDEPKLLGDYDILFVSAMSSDYEGAARLKRLWNKYSNGPMILGGPITSSINVVAKLGYDVGVYGEGEESVPRLVAAVHSDFTGYTDLVKSIRGLILNYNGKVVFTGKPNYVSREKLSYKHSTRLDGYPLFWASRVYVEVVRGCSSFRRPIIPLPDGRKCIRCPICFGNDTPLEKRLRCPVGIPAGCGYCSVPELYGYARSRSIDVIVDEVRELVRKGVTRIVLSGPDILDYGRDLLVNPKPLTDPCKPGPNTTLLRELFERLYDSVPEFTTRDAYLMVENIKACLVNEEVASLLGKYLRGTPVHIGAESGNDNLLISIGRPSLTSDVRRAVALLAKHGLKPYVYFIYALPGETVEAAKATVNFIEELTRLGVEKITAYRFRPLPATAFEDMKTVITEASLMIKKKAIEVNERQKLYLIGSRLRAIVAGWHNVQHSLIAYPLPHGPVALIRGPRNLIGWLVEIEVIDVVNDRMVRARLLRKLKRLKPAN